MHRQAGLHPKSTGVLCVVCCDGSIRCNQRNLCQGGVLKAKTGTQVQNHSVMGTAHSSLRPSPSCGSSTHGQCTINRQQEGNSVIFKARSRVLVYNSVEHPDGVFGCEKLGLQPWWREDSRTQEGGQKPGRNVVLAKAAGRAGWRGEGRETEGGEGESRWWPVGHSTPACLGTVAFVLRYGRIPSVTPHLW